MANTLHNDLFSSLISDIKAYTGKDPLLPWLRGIRKLRESLPPMLLKQKLPRFLQKCTQTFESDRRYRNDLRYLRVWLQLMDFVDDPRALLTTMEMNRIGVKRSLFYQAYALYYEKIKQFEDADKMYHLGVQKLAEPADELQKSYEQFLRRMERHKNKSVQHIKWGTADKHLAESIPPHCSKNKENNGNLCLDDHRPTSTYLEKSASDALPIQKIAGAKVFVNTSQIVMPIKESYDHGVLVNSSDVEIAGSSTLKKEVVGNMGTKMSCSQKDGTETRSDEPSLFCSDDTAVIKFVGADIDGELGVEDVCHHGLVDPTINMKEAMNAINNMFREPLEPALGGRRSHRSQPELNHRLNNAFKVFVDENLDNGIGTSDKKENGQFSVPQHKKPDAFQHHQEPFEIFIDDEVGNEATHSNNHIDDSEQHKVQNMTEGSVFSASHVNAFVFPSPKDLSPKCSDDSGLESYPQVHLREDTVIHRFVGSTISDEPKVENACHHGLVEPTINLKEAMDDINSMFGKPIDFVRNSRRKKDTAPDRKADCGFSILPDDDLEHPVAPSERTDCGGFMILPDEDLEYQQSLPPASSSHKSKECDLFEPTMFTKEAMNDINRMFGMPMDF